MLTQVLSVPNQKVVPVLFAYLFYRIDQRKFLKYIEEQGLVDSRAEAVAIKDRARHSGYVMKNCKLYAWACWTARMLDKPLPKAADFGVAAADAKLLKRLNLRHLEAPDDKFPNFRYAAYSLASFDRTCQRLLFSPELKNYIGKFVTKKMSFLMKSYGEKRHDLEAQLQESALVAWYKQYPRFYSDLHMVNVAKAQIHNVGQTMITSLTAKSRQPRLQRNDDGTFDALTVDVSVVANEVVAPIQYGALFQDHLRVLEQVDHKLNQRAREFLLCMAGQHHAGFSEFLQANNEDLADEWPYQKYLKATQKYFDVSTEKVERLFAGIRKFAYQTNV